MSEQEEQTPPSASALLVTARESLGFSQKEVADKLYLTTTFIRYIDAGEFEKIPKQAFVKGYLRSYARTVNLSGDDIVSLYEAALQAHAPEPEIRGVTEEDVTSSAITGPVFQTGMIGLGGLVLVVALVWWLVSEPDSPPPKVTQPAVQAPERPEPAQQDFDFVLSDAEAAAATERTRLEEPLKVAAADSAADSLQSLDGADDEAETPEPADSEPELDAETESGVEQTNSLEPAAEPELLDSVDVPESLDEIRFERTSDGERSFVTVDAGGFDQVELSFTDECWVEVEDSARGLIYNDLNRQGDVLTLYGTAPFEILLGKATGVEMIYNGRPFDVDPYISQDRTAKITVSE
ncbi:MAG: DUF4115 domain-containing protein [Pseudomonadales bacterium]|nr:DUF4115 domain-containing protein [Pseudomonadales bacterium]MBO7006467.1 DUF4115 domain-containing protein [Pseudomonadales bacterium]